MEFIKSYTLDQSQQDSVAAALSEYKGKHASFNHIVCESEIDTGIFFEDEVEDRKDC